MPETTDRYHRVPVATKKKDARIRTITISKGIKALYDAKNKIIVTYLFDVKKYSMKEAKQWVKKRKSNSAILQAVENISLVKDVALLYKEARNEVLDILN